MFLGFVSGHIATIFQLLCIRCYTLCVSVCVYGFLYPYDDFLSRILQFENVPTKLTFGLVSHGKCFLFKEKYEKVKESKSLILVI